MAFGNERLNKVVRRLAPIVLVLLVLAGAAGFRFYGLRWDGDFGAFPHPDERHLANTLTRLAIPPGTQLADLLDPDTSPLNPRRVNPADGSHYDLAYGTLPIYIYRGVSALAAELGYPELDTYDGYFVVGRFVTVIFALVTVLLTFLVGRTLFRFEHGLLAAALLAVSVLHIQLSHFMTVDLALTMFAAGAIYWAARLAGHGGKWNAFLLGLSLGGAMACKISGATLLAVIVGGLFLWATGPAPRLRRRPWGQFLSYAALILLGTILIYGVFEFYVFLDPNTYLEALTRQSQMVSGENDWPFTRQYVNTTPYIYHLENLARWGLGWPLGVAGLAGLLTAVARWLVTIIRPTPSRGEPRLSWWQGLWHQLYYDKTLRSLALLLTATLPYFAFVGRYEVKFMRYLLPMFPPLCLFAAWFLLQLSKAARRWANRLCKNTWLIAHLGSRGHALGDGWTQFAAWLPILLVLLPTIVWALAFMNIYRQVHPWHDASRWLYNNAPRGANISAESWDDYLPIDLTAEGLPRSLVGGNVTFNIYHDMSTEQKLAHLMDALDRSDYVVLTTARLYGAVSRLPWRYPVENRYYELLFQEKLGFELAHVSMSYPSIWGLTFVDDEADESFWVYDHPQVLIYRKVRTLSETEYRDLFKDALATRPLVTRVGDAPPAELPVPQWRKSLMLDEPVGALPVIKDYAWNRLGSRNTVLAILTWLLTLWTIGLAAWPLTAVLFARFRDRGFLLSKTLGILLVAYLTWMPVSLGLWHYTVWATLAALLATAGLSYGVHCRHPGLVQRLWAQRRRWLRLELVFLVAFAAGILLRLGNPDLWHPVNGGEKPMEFGFLNAILRSPTMPPYDPFFSDGYINYYYYGLFMVSTLAKLSGITPAIAFNLIIATIFALTVSGAFSVVLTLTKRRSIAAIAAILTAWSGPLSGLVPIRGRGGLGEVADAVQQLADPAVQGTFRGFFQGMGRWIGSSTLPLRTDWFWDASRAHGAYENTITEFPFWSFLFADLHPHAINIPFTILTAALAVRLIIRAKANDETPHAMLPPWMAALLTALSLGGLAVANSWDFPTFLLLCTGALFLLHLWRERTRLPLWRRLLRAFGAALMGAIALGGVGLALYFPFFAHFQAFVKGIGTVTYPTEINYLVGFFGLFILLALPTALWTALRRARKTSDATEDPTPVVAEIVAPGASRAAPLPTEDQVQIVTDVTPAPDTEPAVDGQDVEPVSDVPLSAPDKPSKPAWWRRALNAPIQFWPTLVSVLLLPALWFAASSFYPQVNGRQLLSLALLAELVWWTALACLRSCEPLRGAGLWMLLVGWLVALGVEIVYIRDHLGGAWYRMNTVFKFYTHTWVLLSMTSVTAGYHWYRRSDVPEIAKRVWQVIVISLGVLSVLYTAFAIQSRWRDRFPASPPWGTLDGLAYMEYGAYSWEGNRIFMEADYEAIQWMLDNIQGTPVILQAPYGYYRENGVRIAVNTGFPTVLNPLHENEQRYDELIGPRHRDAEDMYRVRDVERTQELLAQYGVEYVYVGPFERAVYGESMANKFDSMLDQGLALVYDQGDVRIYRVGSEIHSQYGGHQSGAAPVVVPTVAPKPVVAPDELRQLERAAKASPGDAGLQFELGDKYRQLGRLKDAAEVFEASLKNHPQDVAMYHTLGDTYGQMGRADDALAQYVAAVEAVPDNAAAYNKLGMAYLERGRMDQAEQALMRVTEIDPAFAEAYYHLGLVRVQLDKLDLARETFQQVLIVGPETDWAPRAQEQLDQLD